MILELDNAPTPAPPSANALVVKTPEQEISALADTASIAVFEATRDQYVEHYKGFVISTPDDLEHAGSVIDSCIATKKGVEGVFKNITDYFFRIHRGLTAQRAALIAPLDELEKSLRQQTVNYRQRVAEAERKAAEEAERKAREKAEAEARAAREKAEAEARAAAAAAQAAAEEAARAAAEDPDAAMEAEAAADAAAARAREASANSQAVREEPVYVPPVYTPAPTLGKGAGGGTLVDNWVAQYEEDEMSTVQAIVAALPSRPDLIELLSINESALKARAKASKGIVKIPGVKIVNKPIDRRVRARG
jgi:chemotaxis protein histidine kinase CheA